MKLLNIDMENLRSYRSENVDFLEGISLFEGDIGSGKSSILNAIEFALFGLGDLNGSHLIRIGENEAKVELEIEINGRRFLLGRTLKRRGRGVHQDTCYIVEDGVKTEYNVTDMKKRVLQLLDFKEPSNPRSHSVIYRYAIFTPQEEMKQVLGQKPSDRKETLRKAFGIEQYHTAAENATELVTDIDVNMQVLKRSEKEIESIKKKIEEENKLIAELDEKITETKEEQETLIQNKKA
ncbi:AAA family ATPase, partial [Candidatus Bathyarchaeota archaeon]|nr:AAA family ATPase [Candidatus Bathyarchaeota archaeon]